MATLSNPFSKTTLVVVIGVAAASLVVAIMLAVLGSDPTRQRSAGTDSYSYSAIGYKGLVELLGRLDIPVESSRDASADKASHGVLVIAEPKLDGDGRARLDQLLAHSKTTLVILPKWYGYAERDSAWIDSAQLQPKSDVEALLVALGLPTDTQLVRSLLPTLGWKASGGLPVPTVKFPQMIAAHDVDVVIGGDAALLLDVTDGDREIWVLADPDVVSNVGLREPVNAELAVTLLDKLRKGGPVVIDETVHGYAQQPSLLRVLFSFPLVLATLQVLICALLAVWAAMVRFGPRRAAPPPLAPGKDFLIANTAALLRYGGHHVHALERYLAANIADVRRALHAPQGLAQRALTEWLERVRKLRGCKISLVDLENEVAAATPTPQRVVETADRIYHWRLEMMHGSRNRT